MAIVGVVSDTHLPRFGMRLPRALVDGFRSAEVDLILHAGDITAAFVLDELSAIAPVEAVAGNNDPPDLVSRLGYTRVLDIHGLRVGLTHGHLGPGRTTPDRARAAFADDDVGLIVFGHSHQPLWVPSADRRAALLNPGSPTDRRRGPAFSYAIVRVSDGVPATRIVRFEDRSA